MSGLSEWSGVEWSERVEWSGKEWGGVSEWSEREREKRVSE